jgi:hypothetical protein
MHLSQRSRKKLYGEQTLFGRECVRLIDIGNHCIRLRERICFQAAEAADGKDDWHRINPSEVERRAGYGSSVAQAVFRTVALVQCLSLLLQLLSEWE